VGENIDGLAFEGSRREETLVALMTIGGMVGVHMALEHCCQVSVILAAASEKGVEEAGKGRETRGGEEEERRKRGGGGSVN
jgi:hypothetical protein